MVRGMIWGDGRVHDAIVQSSERPDLNAEARSLIQQWVFTPAFCNGAPHRTEASFELHFQGR
jgi:outer membrane biosynthesis protein TonB